MYFLMVQTSNATNVGQARTRVLRNLNYSRAYIKSQNKSDNVHIHCNKYFDE